MKFVLETVGQSSPLYAKHLACLSLQASLFELVFQKDYGMSFHIQTQNLILQLFVVPPFCHVNIDHTLVLSTFDMKMHSKVCGAEFVYFARVCQRPRSCPFVGRRFAIRFDL